MKMTKYSEPLKGTKDIMKELNNTQGRYLPVWMKEANKAKKKQKKKQVKSKKKVYR